MRNESIAVQIRAARAFRRHLRALSKKYHHIRSDIQPVLDAIEAGDFIGDRIAGTEYVVFKVRVRNRDIEKGKSSGYRLIYQVKRRSRFFFLQSTRSSIRETFQQVKFER